MDPDSKKLVIRNIGLLLSGKMEEPIYDGDCLVAIDGKITAWEGGFRVPGIFLPF